MEALSKGTRAARTESGGYSRWTSSRTIVALARNGRGRCAASPGSARKEAVAPAGTTGWQTSRPQARATGNWCAPNILVISARRRPGLLENVSAYNRGMMGLSHAEQSIRIAKEGAMFTDRTRSQKLHRGRPAFHHRAGRRFATGLTEGGPAGRPRGTLREGSDAARNAEGQGYATGQFGKNHLGIATSSSARCTASTSFFGNFYHLNAGGRAGERRTTRRDPAFREKFRSRAASSSARRRHVELAAGRP